MRHLVRSKQPNSKMCLVCGLKNTAGLKAFFYELENDELLALFRPQESHQSYPGRLHGGIATAILDETIGRAIMLKTEGDVWGVTVDFSVRYRKPVPLGSEIRVVSRIESDTRRSFEGTGEILLSDGTVAIAGKGRYLKMDISQIADFDHEGDEWQVFESEDDPSVVELP